MFASIARDRPRRLCGRDQRRRIEEERAALLARALESEPGQRVDVPRIEADLRKQQAQRLFAESADTFSNTVYEQADSLQPAADRLKLTVQTAKGLTVALVLVGVFLFTDWPRDVAALVGAGVLLLSRRFHSADVMGFVDWQLLLLFIGLFVVNHAFETTGLAAEAVAWLATQGVHLTEPGALLVLGVALSNLVSNVPAVMLLLPHLGANASEAGMMLALVSTFAGNLLLVGSIANLIVADLARQQGIVIDWKRHAVTGIPVTLLTLAVVWGWMKLA